MQTQFKVVSVLKGKSPGTTLTFRHYDENPRPQGPAYQPQCYHFEPGKTYVVFAKKGEVAGIYRQLWTAHTIKEDQGVFLCADDKPVTAGTVKEVVWPS